jgi:hypothetical protein
VDGRTVIYRDSIDEVLEVEIRFRSPFAADDAALAIVQHIPEWPAAQSPDNVATG